MNWPYNAGIESARNDNATKNAAVTGKHFFLILFKKKHFYAAGNYKKLCICRCARNYKVHKKI